MLAASPLANKAILYAPRGGAIWLHDDDIIDACDQSGRSGRPEVLRLAEVDRPEPGLSEILVRVHAAGLNPADWKHRARSYFQAVG